MLPVTSTDLVFSVAPGNEPNVPDRQGETRPRPRYEESDSEGTSSENSPDLGKESSRRSDDDIR